MPAARRLEVLPDLRRVAVGAADRVGARGSEDLAGQQVRAQRASRAGRADREHGDDVLRLDDARADARLEAERDGRDVAAGHRDALHARQARALGAALLRVQQLGQAVRPGAREVAAVERVPRGLVDEPVVRAAVDHEGLVVELGRDGAGLAVRQREEDHVVAGEPLGGRLDEGPVGVRGEVRVHLAQTLARVLEGGERLDLEARVVGEQAEELPARVAARARDGD